MSRALITTVVFLGLGSAHLAQRGNDAVRRQAGAEQDRFLPNPASMRVASMGQPTLVADALWIRAVLEFADCAMDPTPAKSEWVATMLLAVLELDPEWRTSAQYGGAMLRVVEQWDSAMVAFSVGEQAFPDDAFFPFSMGMTEYLRGGDVEIAYEHVARAAAIPGAPAWYSATAAQFLKTDGGHQAAIGYLQRQLAETTDPTLARYLRIKLGQLQHRRLAEELRVRIDAIESQIGRRLRSLDELGPLPPDPMGVGWHLSTDGYVRSKADETHAAGEQRKSALKLIRSAFGQDVERHAAPAPSDPTTP